MENKIKINLVENKDEQKSSFISKITKSTAAILIGTITISTATLGDRNTSKLVSTEDVVAKEFSDRKIHNVDLKTINQRINVKNNEGVFVKAESEVDFMSNISNEDLRREIDNQEKYTNKSVEVLTAKIDGLEKNIEQRFKDLDKNLENRFELVIKNLKLDMKERKEAEKENKKANVIQTTGIVVSAILSLASLIFSLLK